ncbi:universal stress protein [Nocardioides cavernae]|uniref:Universal stress protein n=1 Tax=Nocardioides cavernae TaxID=1921566 RepID=A0ABR8NEM0_9ACTN|nr:universal stress protein [Nocardioides cavernae]MBD3926583.1 universal stress protein [Nocardioides cavernae]MBM7512304.1 nucleotide-binding universal stress UspA family protein [Nocardioides cavernae]
MTEQGTTAHGPRIVVGVGPEEVESALAFAAAEAVRAGCGLHLVHAVDLTPMAADHVLLPAVDMDAWGAGRIAEAVKLADELVDGAVPVTHDLVRGTPVGALVEVGRTARMVVLEHRHLSRLSRIVNRTVAGGVAAHLRVPVVAVPSGWRPDGEPRVVVAGVDVPERSDEVLRAALAEAHARGARLRLVHSWSLPTAYEGMFPPEDVRGWSDTARAEVCAALDRVGDLTAAMDADVRVEQGRASEVLVEASAGAELLVIGRHDPLVPIGSHVGPVARAVLREATCPVLLATPRPHRAAYHP